MEQSDIEIQNLSENDTEKECFSKDLFRTLRDIRRNNGTYKHLKVLQNENISEKIFKTKKSTIECLHLKKRPIKSEKRIEKRKEYIEVKNEEKEMKLRMLNLPQRIIRKEKEKEKEKPQKEEEKHKPRRDVMSLRYPQNQEGMIDYGTAGIMLLTANKQKQMPYIPLKPVVYDTERWKVERKRKRNMYKPMSTQTQCIIDRSIQTSPRKHIDERIQTEEMVDNRTQDHGQSAEDPVDDRSVMHVANTEKADEEKENSIPVPAVPNSQSKQQPIDNLEFWLKEESVLSTLDDGLFDETLHHSIDSIKLPLPIHQMFPDTDRLVTTMQDELTELGERLSASEKALKAMEEEFQDSHKIIDELEALTAFPGTIVENSTRETVVVSKDEKASRLSYELSEAMSYTQNEQDITAVDRANEELKNAKGLLQKLEIH